MLSLSMRERKISPLGLRQREAFGGLRDLTWRVGEAMKASFVFSWRIEAQNLIRHHKFIQAWQRDSGAAACRELAAAQRFAATAKGACRSRLTTAPLRELPYFRRGDGIADDQFDGYLAKLKNPR